MYGRMSILTDEEIEALEDKIIDIVCRENPSRAEPLASSTLYDMLVEHDHELPDFAMHDTLQGLRHVISVGLGGPQNPHTDPEARSHGGLTITGVCEG
jgi:hypothetical protein